jgi:hypothetical protein
MAALTITAANVRGLANLQNQKMGVAGATIAAGQVVYYDPTSDRYYLAVATAGASAKAAGIALGGAAAGQPFVLQYAGDVYLGAGSAGVTYCVGVAGGAIAPDADVVTPNFKTVLGAGKTGSFITLDIFVSGQAV